MPYTSTTSVEQGPISSYRRLYANRFLPTFINSGAFEPLDTSSTRPKLVVALTKNSRRTVGFVKLKKLKKLPYNPFYYDIIRTRNTMGTITRLNRYNGAPSEEYLDSGVISARAGMPSDGHISITPEQLLSARNECSNKLLMKVKDQKVNIAQAIGERQQTIDLIATTAKRIADGFLALKKGDVVGAARLVTGFAKPSRRVRQNFRKQYKVDPDKAAANAWLELQYGWKPLLQDIYDAAEFAAQRAMKEIKSKATASVTREIVETSKPFQGGQVQQYNGLYDRKASIIVKMQCRFIPTDDASHNLVQLGLTNPFLLAWELLPYSFVVDWFLPIGNWLSVQDATVGLVFLDGGSVTVQKRRLFWEYNKGSDDGGPYDTKYDISATGNQIWDTIEREPLGSFPFVKLPQFKNPLTSLHAANAIALLQGAFKSKPRP